MAQTTILDTIVAGKLDEVAAAKTRVPVEALRDAAAQQAPARGFEAALKVPGTVRLIAEIKKASPSGGLIRTPFDPAQLAREYASAGAACLSVLTDERWFQGSAAYLGQARAACTLPVLRKDFVVDAYQVHEARAMGADAVLLIVACLTREQLSDYQALAHDYGMAALVEVHTLDEMAVAAAVGAGLVGINNRDLHSFTTDLEATARLRLKAPPGCLLVSESGIRSAEDMRWLRDLGVNAALVGEALMRQIDVVAATRELVEAGVSA